MRQFKNFSVQNLLGQVRSLNYITHYMIMQLNYAAAVSIFYSTLFEFVTFDIVPTDEIYAEIFDFDSEPYSEEADNIGYGSRLFIENTGSLFIYAILIALKLLLVNAIIKFCSKHKKLKKVKKWAKRSKSGFLWAGAIEFQDELYLCVALSLGI